MGLKQYYEDQDSDFKMKTIVGWI